MEDKIETKESRKRKGEEGGRERRRDLRTEQKDCYEVL